MLLELRYSLYNMDDLLHTRWSDLSVASPEDVSDNYGKNVQEDYIHLQY